MNVVGRIDTGGRRRFGLGDRRVVNLAAVEHILHGSEAQRPVGDADGADMSIPRFAAGILVVKQRRGRQRKIAAAAGEFSESRSGDAPATPGNGSR